MMVVILDTVSPEGKKMSELKKCPFCGAQAMFDQEGEDWYIACTDTDCEATSGLFTTAKAAETAWNHRTPRMEQREWMFLSDLPNGAIFTTKDGIRAVKTEYYYTNENRQPMCILLASGEFAHFPEKEKTLVCELYEPGEGRE